MDVATILQNIRSQALVGATGAADDTARILRYLNKAYFKVYGKEALTSPSLFEEAQDVVLSDGRGTFSTPLHTITAVYDKTAGGRALTQKSLRAIRTGGDPLLAQTGDPSTWDRAGINGIVAHPFGTNTLTVWGAAVPALLTEDTGEDEILVPVIHHDILEWETLWTIAYDERDKLVGSELQFTRAMADDCEARLLQYLETQKANEERRVRKILG